jgi:hypothetical protein
MTSIHYLALNSREIRVLSLLPGQPGSMIECNYHFAMLDRAKNTFDALSYEWGPPGSPREDIRLQGQIISIGENLWYALHCLRLETSLIELWIDALCLYVDRYQRKYHRNLRFRPLFSEGFRFAGRIRFARYISTCSDFCPFFYCVNLLQTPR